MKKISVEKVVTEVKVEKSYCDLCRKPAPHSLRIPVIFHTEQTEGRYSEPYIEYKDLDLCDTHFHSAVKIHATGAQGLNSYFLKKTKEKFNGLVRKP